MEIWSVRVELERNEVYFAHFDNEHDAHEYARTTPRRGVRRVDVYPCEV